MKKNRSETLSEPLFCVRDKNEEKLLYQKARFPRIAMIAACLLLVFCVVLSIPMLPFSRDDGTPGTVQPSSDGTSFLGTDEDGGVTINSISKMSYYAAVRMIAENAQKTSLSALVSPLWAKHSVDSQTEAPVPITSGPILFDRLIESDDSVYSAPPIDIIYYEIDPSERCSIGEVYMFQIELTDENGFLASKLGLGVVDAVLTVDFVMGESMITFRRGDAFYSCLSSGKGIDNKTKETQWQFTTHKYVEGFYLVKNFENENYYFNITVNQNRQATSFTCGESENGGDHVDQNVKVVGKTAFSNERYVFTVAELEEYYNSGKLPVITKAPPKPDAPFVGTTETAPFVECP